MGWLFSSQWARKNDLVQHILSQIKEPYHTIAHRLVGNHLWVVYGAQQGTEAWQRMNGKNEIVLFKMRFGGGEGGYKDVGENSGPYATDCPVSLFEIAGPPITNTADEWRRRVISDHARKQALRKVKIAPGDVVTYGNVQYRVEKYLGRSGWYVNRVSDGALLRMSARQMNQARQSQLDAQSGVVEHNEDCVGKGHAKESDIAHSQCELFA